MGKIELPIADLPNPLKGEFDLSECGGTGKYLSINTGYRKGKKTANEEKTEIWFAPRFLIERELSTTARHFREIMTPEEWPESAPIGIFWTYGGWDNLEWYDHLTNQGLEELNQDNLYQLWLHSPNQAKRFPPEDQTAVHTHKSFHVCFELNRDH